jgi:hydrogenase maturation factor
MLLPVGSCAADVWQIMRQLRSTAEEFGIILSGGHTEITDTVLRPVISGQMVGTVPRGRLINKREMTPGDCVLLTKGAGIEGTAIIAREMPDRLREAGIPEAMLERCAAFLRDPGISIIPEARAAAETGCVTAMHDVTEGGVATALEEFSIAGGHGIRVVPESIPVRSETAEICEAVGVDPLGLIGSGALLIACRAAATQSVLKAVHSKGVEVAWIGEVVDAPPGVTARHAGTGAPLAWPHFDVDEIARLFAG